MGIFCIVVSTRAEPPSQYGAPAPIQQISNSYGAPADNFGSTQNFQSSSGPGPTIHKYVSVHVAPPEPVESVRSQQQVQQRQEKHYQIVFVKVPSASGSPSQEIQLPPAPEQKTLVYVLLKKPEVSDSVRFSRPAASKPSKPEVYFIRYKGGNQQSGGYSQPSAPTQGYPQQQHGSSSGGYVQQQSRPVSNQYGAPEQRPGSNQYSAPQQRPVSNQYGAPQQRPVSNQYSAPQQRQVSNQYGAPQQSPVFNQHSAPQQRPVSNQYGSPAATLVSRQYTEPTRPVSNQYGAPALPSRPVVMQYMTPPRPPQSQYGAPSRGY